MNNIWEQNSSEPSICPNFLTGWNGAIWSAVFSVQLLERIALLEVERKKYLIAI